jgi:hypothetical protein
MGGSHSKATRDEIPPDPRLGNQSTGLTISQSEGCDGCKLVIDRNISSSSVMITRERNTTETPSTKLIIKPSIPFRLTFNGKEDTIARIELYHPSPVRIENVQHDAVISFIGTSGSIVFVPIVGSSSPTSQFISKISSFMTPLTTGSSDPNFYNRQTGEYQKITIPTGNDWSLSDIFSPEDSFFTWAVHDWKKELVRKRKEGSTEVSVYKWVPTSSGGTRIIFMQNPMGVAATDLQTILQLPVTDPLLPQNSLQLDHVYYKPGPPKGCKTCTPIPPASNPFTEPVAVPQGAGHLDPSALIGIVIGMIAGVAGFIAIYFGVKWAMKAYGNTFKNVGEEVGKLVAKKMEEGRKAANRKMFSTGESSVSLPSSLGSMLPSSRSIGITPTHSRLSNLLESPPKSQIDKIADRKIYTPPTEDIKLPSSLASMLPSSRSIGISPTHSRLSNLLESPPKSQIDKIADRKIYTPPTEDIKLPSSLASMLPSSRAIDISPPLSRINKPTGSKFSSLMNKPTISRKKWTSPFMEAERRARATRKARTGISDLPLRR